MYCGQGFLDEIIRVQDKSQVFEVTIVLHLKIDLVICL